MRPIFGVLFALAGLDLAVTLGTVLYKDESQEPISPEKPLRVQDEGRIA
jgi:hypothetical protein